MLAVRATTVYWHCEHSDATTRMPDPSSRYTLAPYFCLLSRCGRHYLAISGIAGLVHGLICCKKVKKDKKALGKVARFMEDKIIVAVILCAQNRMSAHACWAFSFIAGR